MKPSIFDTITNQIVEAIEAGAGTYCMPWHRSRFDIASPSNTAVGCSYRGINTLPLWMTAEARGYESGQWATYKQWQDQGAQVRKGEKATAVVLWRPRADGEPIDLVAQAEQRPTFVARGFGVFDADWVDGWNAPAVPQLFEAKRVDRPRLSLLRSRRRSSRAITASTRCRRSPRSIKMTRIN